MVRKRLKNRGVVGPRMKAAAEQTLGTVPEELRPSLQAPKKAALFQELAKSLAGTIPPAVAADQILEPDHRYDSEERVAELLKLIADVATGLWRLRSTMQPSEENRRSYKQLGAIFDILTEAGVEIRDHTGEAVPQGGIYGWNVLTYEPTPGLVREQVIETIKPTIYLDKGVIQIGQVIIGTPEPEPI